MTIIRRELPLTSSAGLVPRVLVTRCETHRIKDTRVLLVVGPSTATTAACSIVEFVVTGNE